MNILFLADMNSIHDQKWIMYFKNRYQLHVVQRSQHQPIPRQMLAFVQDHGTIPDFSLFRLFATMKGLFKLRKIIRDFDIDLIHIYYAEPNVLWAIFKTFLNVKIILTTRGTDVLVTIPDHFQKFSLQNFYVRALYRRAFKNCDRITCTSSTQAKSVKKIFGLKSKPQIIRTGIDVSAIENREYNRDYLPKFLHHSPYILMPRNMRPLYFHEFTLDGIHLLPDEIKKRYSFVFVDKDSRDDEYVSKIEKRIEEITDVKVYFLNRQSQDQIHNLYAHASLIVMNPKSDGSPVSALEALVFERPLILGPITYDEDLFGDWVLKLTDWDPEELVEKIINGLRFPGEKIQKGKEVVKRLGDRQIEMEKVNRLYDELIAR